MYTAYLFSKLAGSGFVQLASKDVTAILTPAGAKTLRFEALGNQLKLYINNALQIVAYDSTIADAAFGPDIGVAAVAPPVRSKIGFGFYERARIGDHVQDALIKALGGNRFGEEFGDPGIARHGDAPFL